MTICNVTFIYLFIFSQENDQGLDDELPDNDFSLTIVLKQEGKTFYLYTKTIPIGSSATTAPLKEDIGVLIN